jgi:hypothetical protein
MAVRAETGEYDPMQVSAHKDAVSLRYAKAEKTRNAATLNILSAGTVDQQFAVPVVERKIDFGVILAAYTLLEDEIMGLGRGALLWLLGIPLPIILLLALFWHH